MMISCPPQHGHGSARKRTGSTVLPVLLSWSCSDGPALNQMLLEILHIVWLGSLWRASEPSRKTLTGAQVAGLRCRAEIAPRHIGNHARAKGCRWCGLLNVHQNVLCQSRQNHLDQQHTPNTKTRATNSYAAQHPPQAPLSRSDLVLGP